MSDLFLSYAREDRECAESFAEALKGRGWTVWWDRRIQVGRSFSAEIERELDASACVLVLWSRSSIRSEWVQNEATEAAQRKVLVPVRIEDVRPPLEFRRLQTADLFDWRNGFKGPEFEACMASIEALARREGKSGFATVQVKLPQPSDYWIHQGGKQFHAPDVATLVQWAKEGRVHSDAQVYESSRKQYIRARDMEALRGAFEKKPEPPPNETTPTADYWIHQGGKQFHAPDIATLVQWAREGRVHSDAQVYESARKQYTRARDLDALRGVFDKKPEPPPNEFWIDREGNPFAVPDLPALRKLAEDGGIDAETSIHDPRLRRWVFARAIPELKDVFPTETSPPVAAMEPALVSAPTPEPAPVASKPKHGTTLPSRQFLVAFTIVGAVLTLVVIATVLLNGRRPPRSIMETIATDTSLTAWNALELGTANTDTVVTGTSATEWSTVETSATDAASTATISVSLTNTCKDKTISAAIAYVDATGTWVSRGWFILTPGETKSDLAQATNQHVYFYGVSGAREWSGGEKDALKHPIPVHKSDAFRGAIEKLTGTGFEKVSFFGRNVPAGQTTWTQVFECR